MSDEDGGDLFNQIISQSLHKHHFGIADYLFYLSAPSELKPLVEIAIRNEYFNLRFTENQTLCGLCSYIFTVGLHVNLSEYGYEDRYCYETLEAALEAYITWDGIGEPSGYTRAIKA